MHTGESEIHIQKSAAFFGMVSHYHAPAFGDLTELTRSTLGRRTDLCCKRVAGDGSLAQQPCRSPNPSSSHMHGLSPKRLVVPAERYGTQEKALASCFSVATGQANGGRGTHCLEKDSGLEVAGDDSASLHSGHALQGLPASQYLHRNQRELSAQSLNLQDDPTQDRSGAFQRDLGPPLLTAAVHPSLSYGVKQEGSVGFAPGAEFPTGRGGAGAAGRDQEGPRRRGGSLAGGPSALTACVFNNSDGSSLLLPSPGGARHSARALSSGSARRRGRCPWWLA
ncbi:uncharacterized protein LOC118240699 [Electrophorus electricus]|uniref:uncharacterized protein LOC118240699 n=1 Tax=Electrophorus electricus TaxID=8005 RepID=UPI0015D021D4|nr:uncharacterized protein LOC118240699 [Electrophorus electricus]